MAQDPKLTKTPFKESKYVSWYHWEYEGELTVQEAAQKQTEAGYDPAGYGFYSHKVKDGITTWQSSNNCD